MPETLTGSQILCRALLEQAQAQCQKLLSARRRQLDALARALLEREVLSGEELKGLLGTGAARLTARTADIG